MSTICVLIPTYNEAQNLPRLTAKIEKALHNSDFEMLIIDDNSPDRTAGIAEKLSMIYGNITVRVQAKKSGLGVALLAGLKEALSKKDIQRIVTLDADFSHDPNDIPRLLQAAESADLIQGSRYVQNGAVVNWGFKRRLISCAANLVCYLLIKSSIHDCTGNFRVYTRDCAEAIVRSAKSKGFEWVVEAMMVAKQNGFRVKEVPITFADRKEGRTKLKGSQVLNWGVFAVRNLISQKFMIDRFVGQSSFMSQRSSTLATTETPPITSTTM
jgi:dolichol-phosphate mannosyltransferase